MTRFTQIVRQGVVLPIIIYQKIISLDHGPLKFLHPHGYCQFYPSCSEYCRQAILKKGLIVGAGLSIWRLMRCHPWSKGGVDEINRD